MTQIKLYSETKSDQRKFFDFRNPLFWIVILLLINLGSIWLTFIKVIDWLHIVATH